MVFAQYIQVERLIDKLKLKDNLIFPSIFEGMPVKGFFTTKLLNGNIQVISELIKIPVSNIYQPIQKHTDKIILLNSNLNKKVADAVITNRANILIGIDVADCVPILIYDRKVQAIGAVHAGWRGTSHEILKKSINEMSGYFGSLPSDIIIAIGPAIRQCCYEVGAEVFDSVCKSSDKWRHYIKKGEKYFIDLPLANACQALSMGVPMENIWDMGDCTHCNPERFFSYRYSKGKTGRQSGFIGIFPQ